MRIIHKAVSAGAAIGLAAVAFAPAAAAFEPPKDPQDKFTCTAEGPVPGHPGFPGVATGTAKSAEGSGMRAAGPWSATELFGGPLAVC